MSAFTPINHRRSILKEEVKIIPTEAVKVDSPSFSSEHFRQRLNKLKTENETLKQENNALKAKNSILCSQNHAIAKKLSSTEGSYVRARTEIKSLKQEISEEQHKKAAQATLDRLKSIIKEIGFHGQMSPRKDHVPVVVQRGAAEMPSPVSPPAVIRSVVNSKNRTSNDVLSPPRPPTPPSDVMEVHSMDEHNFDACDDASFYSPAMCQDELPRSSCEQSASPFDDDDNNATNSLSTPRYSDRWYVWNDVNNNSRAPPFPEKQCAQASAQGSLSNKENEVNKKAADNLMDTDNSFIAKDSSTDGTLSGTDPASFVFTTPLKHAEPITLAVDAVSEVDPSSQRRPRRRASIERSYKVGFCLSLRDIIHNALIIVYPIGACLERENEKRVCLFPHQERLSVCIGESEVLHPAAASPCTRPAHNF